MRNSSECCCAFVAQRRTKDSDFQIDCGIYNTPLVQKTISYGLTFVSEMQKKTHKIF